MENTVYYIYSTISQTLAAMVALLGVFSIYMLQSLNNKFIDISQGYLDFLNRMEKENNPNYGFWFTKIEFNKLIISKQYQGILALADREYKKWADAFPELSNFSKSITKIRSDKENVIKKTLFIRSDLSNRLTKIRSDKENVIKKTLFITISSLIIIIGSLIMLSMATKMHNLTFWILFILFISAIGYVFLLIFQLIKFSLSSDL